MILAIIPARYASSRFPGKPLIDLCGKPMIQRVCERASQARGITATVVATDDRRIADVVRAFGGQAVLTSPACASGTDRLAEALQHWRGPRPSVVVNVQGDEPLIPPALLEQVVSLLRSSKAPMATLMRPLRNKAQWLNMAVTKVVCDRRGRALLFSRAPIPLLRDSGSFPRSACVGAHVGLYAYRPQFLRSFARLSPGSLEQAEKLEQLRALEYGWTIAVGRTSLESQAVDTPADAALVRRLISRRA